VIPQNIYETDNLLLTSPHNIFIKVTLGNVVAVRGQRVAFSAEADLASMLIDACPRVSIERVSEIEAVFAAAAMRPLMNLLQREFTAGVRGKSRWSSYRRPAVLATVAALSPLAIWTAETVRNEAAARGLEVRAEAMARAIIGDAQSSDAIAELRGRLAELSAGNGFMQTTAALFEAISQAKDVELENLSYLRDGVTRATLIHSAASDIGVIREALQQSGIALDEDAAQERDRRLATTVTLNGRQ
jgi:type II secretory pathway component PulL